VKALKAVKAPLTGVILNKVNLAKPDRYSRGYGVYGVYMAERRQNSALDGLKGSEPPQRHPFSGYTSARSNPGVSGEIS
jgi:hypothetical protein